ncbi:DUF692 domain-containing protein [Novosphingobium sp.]|uniref:MNIO family bufferin maturase n=1 Tax=Novosphingobium sp. TaxID=1874826 RepID=UPI0025E6F6AE|nr:DUF692 domain-containing protein [Novosphingobium sp.]
MIPTAGIGLKARHFDEAMISSAVGLWFEVHAENYMVGGGPRLAMLEQVRAERPLSLHGVGLSLAGHELPDVEHLAALKRLIDRFEPFLISEHLAWSRWGSRALPDLLPFPRSAEALLIVCRNIDFAQSLLGRQLLIENPSHYLDVNGHNWSETDFLGEVAARTGCGLLLDLNNVQVSANNLGFAAGDYLASFPVDKVGEVHLAGASSDAHLQLLIDTHGAPVADEVWDLFGRYLENHGPVPTLIEWDRDVPVFPVLIAERDKAARMMAAISKKEREYV